MRWVNTTTFFCVSLMYLLAISEKTTVLPPPVEIEQQMEPLLQMLKNGVQIL